MRHGGTANRPGTQFVGETKDSSKIARMIPFVFNASQTYILEFGDLYMRVIKNGTPIRKTPQNISAITSANPCVVTYSGADTYANGDQIYISGITTAIGAFLNGRTFKVAGVNTGANTLQLNYLDSTAVNSTAFGSYSSGGGTIAEVYTIVSPYSVANLPDLKYAQSADVVVLVHPSVAPYELTRAADDDWTLANVIFGPSIAKPNGDDVSVSGGSSTGLQQDYTITAVGASGEESLKSKEIFHIRSTEPSDGTPNVLTLDSGGLIDGASYYNIYRYKNGIPGYLGSIDGASVADFKDTGQTIDTTIQPPRFAISPDTFPPATATFFQQRLLLGGSNAAPETIYASYTGSRKNFTTTTPIQDDSTVTVSMQGRQVNQIKHMLDLGKLVVLSSGGEHTIESNSGILTPTDVIPKQYSYQGASGLSPLLVGNSALYVQARGSVVRDLGFEFEVDGYRGNELTIAAPHLVEGFTLDAWGYQQVPHSIAWMKRSDGKMIALTYVKEQQIFGWHRHDANEALIEDVCVIPEGGEDVLYWIVKRTIGGATKRYIERMSTRTISDIVEAIFMDSALTYDGRNALSTTMTLSGSGWTHDTTLTLTASGSFFSTTDVGNEIHLRGLDTSGKAIVIRCSIEAYSSATVVTVRPDRDVPTTMRVAITDWSRAVDEVTGLWHLEGQTVSVLADGFVEASPNNPAYDVRTVTNGILTLSKCYGVINVGVPYISDLETLDIDSPQGETMADKHKLITSVSLHVQDTRGLWVGAKPPTDDDVDPLEDLFEPQLRSTEDYDDPVALSTGVIKIDLKSEWNSNGRVFIRQVDPLPCSILAVTPTGLIPISRGA